MGLVVAFLWPQELQSWGLGWPEAPLTPSRVRGEGSSLSSGTSILEGGGVTDLALRGRNSTYPTGGGPCLLAPGLPRPPAEPAPPSSGRRRRGQDGPNASELGGSPGKAWDCTERGDPEPRRQRAGDGGRFECGEAVSGWVGGGGEGPASSLSKERRDPLPSLQQAGGDRSETWDAPGCPPAPTLPAAGCGLGAWTPRPLGSAPASPAPSCPLQLWLPAVTGPWGLSCPLWGRGSCPLPGARVPAAISDPVPAPLPSSWLLSEAGGKGWSQEPSGAAPARAPASL